MIQWLNWDQAGYAYADAQMDPRTGQVLHAQIFLPSSFAFGGIEEARKFWKVKKETKEIVSLRVS